MSQPRIYILEKKNKPTPKKRPAFSMASFRPNISLEYQKLIKKHAESQERIKQRAVNLTTSLYHPIEEEYEKGQKC